MRVEGHSAWCSTLWCGAVHGSVLQCVAVCSLVQQVTDNEGRGRFYMVNGVAARCSVLRCDAVRCSVLRCTRSLKIRVEGDAA